MTVFNNDVSIVGGVVIDFQDCAKLVRENVVDYGYHHSADYTDYR